MLAEDIAAGGGDLKIRQSDAGKFEVGRNLAVTPGKVIFENELMQLIQYAPATPSVLKTPLLICPPWINKFYVLDLTPEKSFIKWCVDQGLTVFVISWVNPDERLKDKDFEDYMRRGPPRRTRRHRTGNRREQGPHHRLLRRRHAVVDHARLYGGEERPPRRIGDAVRRAGRFYPRRRPQGVRRRGAARGAGKADGRARLSRRQQDGQRLQHAALERPDLALHHQQLPARQGADAVRPALLEFGRDADAGRQPRLLSAPVLSQQHPVARQDDDRQRPARPEKSDGAGLQSRHPRGPHRAGASRRSSARNSSAGR